MKRFLLLIVCVLFLGLSQGSVAANERPPIEEIAKELLAGLTKAQLEKFADLRAAALSQPHEEAELNELREHAYSVTMVGYVLTSYVGNELARLSDESPEARETIAEDAQFLARLGAESLKQGADARIGYLLAWHTQEDCEARPSALCARLEAETKRFDLIDADSVETLQRMLEVLKGLKQEKEDVDL